MPRGDTLKRQWSLVQVLQTHRFGISLDDLAEHLGCNRRTVQRDINVLRDVGLPIHFATDEDQHGQRRYSLPHGYLDRNELLLTITEALSLYLAKAFMAPLAGQGNRMFGKPWPCNGAGPYHPAAGDNKKTCGAAAGTVP
jgi:predicted DNA-binding transcriptional regulator YafY